MELLNAIGTGNIVGVGTAIALGGPGAVLWCWLNSESDWHYRDRWQKIRRNIFIIWMQKMTHRYR